MIETPQRHHDNNDKSHDIDPVTQQGSDLATTLLTLKTDARISENEEETCKSTCLIPKYCSEPIILTMK